MSELQVNMTLRPYDHLVPLFLGDVQTPGLKLNLDHRMPMVSTLSEDLAAAEVSFNRYVLAAAKGDDSIIGLPAFILRGFRHRNYIVRRDSPLENLGDLRGTRIGTNSWSDTGTMWARAAMRDAGVEVTDVNWVIGDLDEATPLKPPTHMDVDPPQGTQFLRSGQTLMGTLRDGGIDALTTAFMPNSVFEPNGEFRRLVRNFREVEGEFHRRTGVYPGFHIVAVRRDFAEAHPQAVMTLYDALRASWNIWWTKAKKFAESSPWAMEEIETQVRDFSGDIPPFGTESDAHKRMLAMICHEQFAQGLIPSAARPEELFAGFDSIKAQVSG
jgi:4,5-dihydroxyphthalate decarboxylase